MRKTTIMMPMLAIAVSMMVLSVSAVPVSAEGARFSFDLSGMARVNGGYGNGNQNGNGALMPATLFMASTELPAVAEIAIGDEDGMEYYTEVIVSVDYVLDPAGVQGVDMGDITINFESGGSLSGDIAYAAQAYIYPGYIYYFELAGLNGSTGTSGFGITFEDFSGECWTSNVGDDPVNPE